MIEIYSNLLLKIKLFIFDIRVLEFEFMEKYKKEIYVYLCVGALLHLTSFVPLCAVTY